MNTHVPHLSSTPIAKSLFTLLVYLELNISWSIIISLIQASYIFTIDGMKFRIIPCILTYSILLYAM